MQSLIRSKSAGVTGGGGTAGAGPSRDLLYGSRGVPAAPTYRRPGDLGPYLQGSAAQHSTTQHDTAHSQPHNANRHQTAQSNPQQHTAGQHSTEHQDADAAPQQTVQRTTTQHSASEHGRARSRVQPHEETRRSTTPPAEHSETRQNTTLHTALWTTQHSNQQHRTAKHTTSQHSVPTLAGARQDQGDPETQNRGGVQRPSNAKPRESRRRTEGGKEQGNDTRETQMRSWGG